MPHYYDQILNILREILTAYTALHRQLFNSISVYAPYENVCFTGINVCQIWLDIHVKGE